MNWGYKILIVYLSFIAGILFLVFKSSSQKVDLVTPDYYQKELKYEQKIDEAERAQSLSSPLQYEVDGNKISIIFPGEMKGKLINAKTLLYYAADENRDSVYQLQTDSAKVVINLPARDKGMYEVKMDWNVDSTRYYSEHKVLIK
ncbi:MAG: FixH family protein [Ginsengibacter sp.]